MHGKLDGVEVVRSIRNLNEFLSDDRNTGINDLLIHLLKVLRHCWRQQFIKRATDHLLPTHTDKFFPGTVDQTVASIHSRSDVNRCGCILQDLGEKVLRQTQFFFRLFALSDLKEG